MSKRDEESRLLKEYADRDTLLPWNNWRTNIYHPRHPTGSLFHEHNHEILVEALNRLGLDLANLRILDVGCGYGYWLRYLVELGADPGNCYGIDLSDSRIAIAKHKNPAINWRVDNLDELSFENDSFDLVLQTVVFSSILAEEVRLAGTSEMKRVLRAGGHILWIDLIKSTPGKLSGFSLTDIKSYFPGMQVLFHKPVQPRYFRRINGKLAWVSKVIYEFIDFRCESRLIVLRKSQS
jgi:ubiquinone/menaquinone biosynthesis C-methylase UbiE